MDWIELSYDAPPINTLVLVWMGDFAGYGLREITGSGDWYDENSNLDDSGNEIVRWMLLPAPEGHNGD